MELELHQDKAEYVLDEWFNQDEKLVDITFDILYTADCKIKPNTLHKKAAETLMVIDQNQP